MKKKIFSVKLYIEALRQTKIIGIMAFVVLTIQAIAIPIGGVVENITYDYVGKASGIDFGGLNPLLFALVYFVAPLLSLTLFSFLNKRNSSDFYHSIADTRTSLFVSYIAAIYTWIIALCLSTTAIGVFFHVIFPKCFTVNAVNVWLTTFNILAASLFSASAVALAMSLTGTIITNLAVSGLILILPDYLLFMLNNLVISEVPIMQNGTNLDKLLPTGFNALSGELNYLSIGSGIYTIIIAIVIALITLIIFKHRNSESAGYPALNGYLQAAIRITFCMIVCIFACGGIFVYTVDAESVNATGIFVIILTYIAALVVYLLYELITTRKFKKLVKSFPALLIVVVLNLVCIFGMVGMYNSYLAFEPSADEISYIKIDQSGGYVYDINSYLEKKCSDIKLKNNEIKEIISESLSKNIAAVKKDTFYDNFDAGIYVTISVRGIEHKRFLTLSKEDYDRVTVALKESDEYKNAYTTLPNVNNISIDKITLGNDLLDKDIMHLYDMLKKEIEKTSFEEWYSISSGYENSYTILNFYGTVIDGTDTYEIYIPLYNAFKETANEYFGMIYNEDISETIIDIMKSDNESFGLNISFYDTEIGELHYYYSTTDNEDYSELKRADIKQLTDMLIPCKEFDADDTVVQINIYQEIGNGYDEKSEKYSYVSKDYTAFFKYTGKDINEFKTKK